MGSTYTRLSPRGGLPRRVAPLLGLLACTAKDAADTHPTSDDSAPDTASGPGALTWLSEARDLDAQRIVAVDATGADVTDVPIGPPPGWTEPQPPLLADFQLLDGGGFLLVLDGYGLEEIDSTGAVVWTHADTGASHDADRLANGNTLYARGWAEKGDLQAIEVDPDGNTVWSWDGLDAYGSDPRFADFSMEGWAHIDGVMRLDDGTTMLCSRNFNGLIGVDPSGAVVSEYTFQAPPDSHIAQTTGAIDGDRPHACELLADGTFLVGLRTPHRALRLDPATDQVLWEWSDDDVVGVKDVDRLPDGHYVVSSKDAILELDDAGTEYWRRDAPDDGGTQPEWDTGDTGMPPKLPHEFGPVVRVSAEGEVFDSD